MAAFVEHLRNDNFSTSKRHPLEELDSGADAAKQYMLRHPRGLRQLQRQFRIAAGKRPLKYGVPTKRERIVTARALLRAATERKPDVL